ncbi:unnamed protein product [Spirodela intermedia]|uniref:Kinetochore protein Nuf2 N-terminal domain-containing protein n=1 Tax=Spirodela intermedia TaxID=51605 RepID=A0A7I8J1Y3_SPIIN|nr:unnamed protein product [Spirodela intermedia]CAA6664079.1 unnamed protein product [Spirodela intermedia]
MSNYSSPEFTPQEIAGYLAEYGIATVNPEDIDRPTADFVCSVYGSVISFLDPLGDDDNEQIDFDALECLENPEYHTDSIRIINFYRKVRDMLAFIGIEFVLRDLLRPDRARTKAILCTVINFLLYRNDKLADLQPIVDQCNDDRRIELEARISELKREISEHEMAREQEQPYVQEIEAEVRGLKQNIQERNKEQMALKTHFKRIKEKIDAINDKISQADFELLGNAQENSKLSANIVQSPVKLQRKKAKRAEVKNAERSAMLSVQSKTATLEVYTKACEKITKHLSKLQNLQEQVTAAKTVEKEVKGLKTKLSDEELSIVSLDAKIDELQGKAKQAEELIKAMEKERDLRFTEHIQKLNAVKSEIEQKLHDLEQREEKTKAVVLQGESLTLKATSVREGGKLKQQELLAKSEEIVHAFHSYSALIDPFLERARAEAEKAGPVPMIPNRVTEETTSA